MEFAAAAIFIFLFTYLQNIVQTYVSELVARDMRGKLVAKISLQSQAYIQQATPAKLLTNLTSDVDAVKLFVSQAVASIVSSVFLIIGASVLLLITIGGWRLRCSASCRSSAALSSSCSGECASSSRGRRRRSIG